MTPTGIEPTTPRSRVHALTTCATRPLLLLLSIIIRERRGGVRDLTGLSGLLRSRLPALDQPVGDHVEVNIAHTIRHFLALERHEPESYRAHSNIHTLHIAYQHPHIHSPLHTYGNACSANYSFTVTMRQYIPRCRFVFLSITSSQCSI